MKTKTAFILAVLTLTAFGATAQAKPHSAAQLRDLSRQAAANAQICVPSLPTAGNAYESVFVGTTIVSQPGPRSISGPVRHGLLLGRTRHEPGESRAHLPGPTARPSG